MLAFTVIDEFTLIFHTQITNLRAELNEDAGPLKAIREPNLYLDVNFDNFRTFSTENCSDKKKPTWTTEKRFNYETRYPESLRVKKMYLRLHQSSFKSKHVMLGEASIDLKSISTGPREIVLSLHFASTCVGKVFFTCEMNELRESIFAPLRIKLTPRPNLFSGNCSRNGLSIRYYSRSFPKGVCFTSKFDIENPNDVVYVAEGTEAHHQWQSLYLGGTIYALIEDAVYFSLCDRSGKEIAGATIGLMLEDADLTDANKKNLRDGQCCTLTRTIELVDCTANVLHPELEVLADLVVDAKLSDLPRHAQMAGGRNVDGAIENPYRLAFVSCLNEGQDLATELPID